MCSLSLPLHEGLIVSTDGVEMCVVVVAEEDANNVLGVTTVGSGLALDNWVTEEVHEAVVITSGHEHLVAGASNGVDVGTIGARWVDTLSLPLEFDGLGSPLNSLGVRAA